MELNLKVEKIDKNEVRRGWVRINENSRGNIKSRELVKISHNNKSVKRIVLGEAPSGTIQLDEETREVLGLKNQLGKNIYLEFKQYSLCTTIFSQIAYYWNHPDFPVAFSTRIAIILGLLSVILGIISFF